MKIVDIAGRFTIADLTPEYLAVGFIGSAWADSLTPAQLDHVRGFYGMTGKRVEVWPDAFTEAFTAGKFADVLFSQMLSAMLRQDYDPSTVLEIVRRTLY